MNAAMTIARARTELDKLVGAPSPEAEAAWASVRPKLDLSHGMATVRRRTRLAKNILAANLPSPTSYLEVGSFEGGSLAFVHALLKGELRATAIDPFENYGELPTTDMSSVETRFRANIKAIGAQVRVMRGASLTRLPELIAAGETFDLIYVDGSHAALDVVVDAILCWRLLAPRGLMIFDDYRYPECRAAINAFVDLIKREVIVVEVWEQVFLRRRS